MGGRDGGWGGRDHDDPDGAAGLRRRARRHLADPGRAPPASSDRGAAARGAAAAAASRRPRRFRARSRPGDRRDRQPVPRPARPGGRIGDLVGRRTGAMSTLVTPWPGVRRRHRGARLHAFQRRPVVYGAMVVYTFVSIGLMARHSVGLTSEHVILIGIVAFAVVGRARPFVWDWLP